MDSAHSKPQNSKILLFAFLIFLISGPEFSTDMYVPSLPSIADYLKISKDMAALTITTYLLGMGIFQFLYGGLSDRLGRKKVLIISTIICLIGNILSLSADSFTMLAIGRLIQGAGAGASVAMTIAIARDIYEGPQLAKAFSILFSFYFCVFGCAPIIGGYLQHYLNWRYNFIVLAAYFGVQLLWVIFLFRETATLATGNNQPSFKTLMKNYLRPLTSKVFMCNMLACTFIYSALFAYAALTPFLFQKELGLSPVDYGWLGLFIATGLVLGNVSGSKLVTKLDLDRPNYYAMILLFVGSIVMFILSFFNLLSIWVVMVPFAVFLVGLGITGVTCPANAFTPFGDIAGTVGATWGGLQFLILFAISFIYAHLNAKTQLPFASSLLALSIIGTVFLLWVMPKKK